ncbi:MAG: hypothetical protein IH820_08190 [Bacteroidetes bacterium]|nr:hypothetical protein [Bacteroidota bacterium]
MVVNEIKRVDWKKGIMVIPPIQWFHQHFNTGPVPAKQLALRWGSVDYLVGFHSFLTRHSKDYGGYVSVKEGGTMIEYQDEDPTIRREYEDALSRDGIASAMPAA